MNIERMTILAETLERGSINFGYTSPIPIGFDIRDFVLLHGHYCAYPRWYNTGQKLQILRNAGLSVCIGGLAVFLFVEDATRSSWQEMAIEALDLTRKQSDQLFFNGGQYVSPLGFGSEITREVAGAAVRRMIAEHIISQGTTIV